MVLLYNSSKLLLSASFLLTKACARRTDRKVARKNAMTVECNVKSRERMVVLGQTSRGYCGRVHAIEVRPEDSDLPEGELERRLLEFGFTEGAYVEILHEGLFGRDPIAVRVNDTTVAIRRREAMAILVSTSDVA